MRVYGAYTLLFFYGAALYVEAQENLRGPSSHTIDENKSKDQVVGDDYSSKRFLNLMNEASQANEIDTRYVVKFKEGINIQTARISGRKYDKIIEIMPKDNSEVIDLNSLEAVQEMEEREEVESVEKDHKVYLQQFTNEQVPYGINLVNALDVPDNNVSNRKVCIIDTGYDIDHPDLPNASTGATITGTGGGNLDWFKDGNGHGTHVAGTIAAVGNNNRGVVGVNRNGQLNLHIVRVFNNNGSFVWASSLLSAVEDCAANGANVVNMSLGGGPFTSFENDGYKRIFEEEGVLIVAAAGNDGNTRRSYPASYDAVMSVAAVDSDEKLANFSQRNSQVEIAAPGKGILSTYPGGRYRLLDGTSMACPHVAGVAALVWSNFPEKSAVQIRAALQNTAKDLGEPGRDDSYGYGLIQADQANLLLSLPPTPTATPTPELTCNDSPPGWNDADGAQYTCQWYSRFGRCNQYGDRFRNLENGKTANEACCVCGGGRVGSILNTKQPSSIASSPPSSTPVDVASEIPSIEASLDPSATPSAIPSERPTQRPSPSPSDTPTLSPTNPVPSTSPSAASEIPSIEASFDPSATPTAIPSERPTQRPTSSPSDTPTMSPTNPVPSTSPSAKPTKSPSTSTIPTTRTSSTPSATESRAPAVSVCVDTGGWYDSGGPRYDCEWYNQNNYCARYGNFFLNYGETAKDACCACGGGSASGNCVNIQDWNDSGGRRFTCAWYGVSGNVDRCLTYGNSFANSGYTANTACCVCKDSSG